ncbi:polyhydroxyalkanoic acid system family protein [Bradymonas sediminis]|uniref:Uncharacterized protein n=1 Tax=Bradymonas sediminis TaxID=1548548 RepID=A0A2Z4FHQ6_9DELT|nr:polyhydroxyalkanoic acid system family protein [Bradymonas sediminis]AWV88196.1 hypothetical protein DN745_02120 [Bradymonas sediminis]TDP77320.1 putative polyhydroxyalkanoic acid system protein [Bradymonas sediminis]
MKHVIPHGLSIGLAEKATHKALETYAEKFAQYNAKVDWQGERKATVSFSVKGVSLSGDVEVDENNIALDMSVPFLLKPFQKKAVAVVDEQVKDWIGRAKAGELDDEA